MSDRRQTSRRLPRPSKTCSVRSTAGRRSRTRLASSRRRSREELGLGEERTPVARLPHRLECGRPGGPYRTEIGFTMKAGPSEGTFELMRGPLRARMMDRLARRQRQRLVAGFVTNVPGPGIPLLLAGAPIAAMWPVAVLDGTCDSEWQRSPNTASFAAVCTSTPPMCPATHSQLPWRIVRLSSGLG
jgi:hypothetical protein